MNNFIKFVNNKLKNSRFKRTYNFLKHIYKYHNFDLYNPLKKSLIDVVIPVYNVEKYLDQCISSVINQTFKKIKIILVNDGSTDNSRKICEKWKSIDKRIILINQENEGLSSARNKGLKYSKSKYVFFLDSDDYLNENDVIFKLYLNLIKYKVDVVISGYKAIDESNFNNVIMTRLPPLNILINDKNYPFLYDEDMWLIQSWGKLYKRSLFNNINFLEHHNYEDLYIFPSLFSKINRILTIDCISIIYRVRNTSITSGPYSINNLDELNAHLCLMKFYKDNNNLNALIKHLNFLIKFQLTMHQDKVKKSNNNIEMIKIYNNFLDSFINLVNTDEDKRKINNFRI